MHRNGLIFCSLFLAGLALSLLISAITSQPSQASLRYESTSPTESDWRKLHPHLVRLLANSQQDQMIPLIIEYQRDESSLMRLGEESYPSKEQRRQRVVTALQEESLRSTASLMQTLIKAKQFGTAKDVRVFWASPVISLKAKPELIKWLLSRPEVIFIRPDEKIELQVSPPNELTFNASDEFIYNLDLIEVDKVEQFLQLHGQGVVIASIDSGVDGYHPALMKQYRGYNPHGPAQHHGNWYVVTGEPYLYPGDGLGHGTHTMGTILGDDGLGHRIGVAPQARWIAVKAFTNQGFTYESWLHAAFEWVLAPAGDPSLAPDIVNNSWGTDNGNDTRFRADVQSLRAAGILPVFSAGNKGPQEGTIAAPASYPESLAVGAVDETKLPTHFSSRGPSDWGEVKPEISAPGVNVISAFPGGGYAKMDGTSMAAPHITGVAALLLEANPNLTVDQLEQILLHTTEPLSNTIPNNVSGYGLVNAYAAALQVSQQGLLQGTIKDVATQQPIPYANLIIQNRNPLTPTVITISTQADGSFECHLPPDLYDLTASRFDYEPQTKTSINIQPQQTNTVEFFLSPRPSGIVLGKVMEVSTQIPLSATLTVLGTPLSVQSNPNNGEFQLRLPQGSWQIRVRAERHRIQIVDYTVAAGQIYPSNILLEKAPHILLVDSGAWYYRSQIGYFERALEANRYPYHKLSIRSPFGINGLADDRPSTTTLRTYDLVIWSSPGDSPGLLELGAVISDYLTAGGNLLLSGEDIAYLDGGGPNFFMPQYYFQQQMGILYQDEGLVTPLYGKENTPFADLRIDLNTPDSAQQQTHPDSVVISNTLRSNAALTWSGNQIGGVLSEYCVPFKSIWLGFGLEGAGPQSTRHTLLQRAIEWYTSPKARYALFTHFHQNTMIAEAGQTVTGTFQIVNRGTQADTYLLEIQGATWPTSIQLPSGQSFNEVSTLSLAPCASAILTATVQIPSTALRQQNSSFTLRITSQNDPALQATLAMNAKTPAPLLIVDDQLWYDYLSRFLSPFEDLALPADIFTTRGFEQTPTSNILKMYPVVVWTTGYDWYFTLTDEEERHLTEFLDQGGGLLLSSQDLLDLRQGSDFVREKLGIGVAAFSVTSTQSIPFLQNPLKLPPQAVSLSYPFRNWSDAISPSLQTIPLLMDENLNLIGTLYPPINACSAFFSIPLETMPEEPRRLLLQRSVFWLSPYGDSQFDIPPAGAKGATLPISISLKRRTPSSFPDRFIFPIPANTTLVQGSLSGPWSYSATENALVFQGNLLTSQPLNLAATLLISDQMNDGDFIPIEGIFYDQSGLVTKYRQRVAIGQPYLEVWKASSFQSAYPGNLIEFQLTLQNQGVVPDQVIISETLSDQLQLIPSSISSDNGTLEVRENSFLWHGILADQQATTLRYQARLTRPSPRGFVYSRTQIHSSSADLLAFAKIHTPWLYYFPFIGK